MKNPYLILEACVETPEEAIRAELNGAHRLELCSRLDLDGLTPDKDLIRRTVDSLTIPVKVMIRPRAGDFVYSESELEQMIASILLCKQINVKGVVFGILDENNKLNLRQIKMLAELSKPLEVTIHKAIDLTPDILESVTSLKKIGAVSSILSSGGATTAMRGKETLREMIKRAGTVLKVIAAGNITNQNLAELHRFIGSDEYHGRKIVGDLHVG